MKSKEFKSEITELVGPIKENPKNNWCKYILKVSYNDKPANIDIRNIKFNEDGTHTFGKGITLTDEECDVMVDMLVDRGYGSTDKLEEAVKKKKSIYGGDFFENDEDDTNGKLVIKLGKD